LQNSTAFIFKEGCTYTMFCEGTATYGCEPDVTDIFVSTSYGGCYHALLFLTGPNLAPLSLISPPPVTPGAAPGPSVGVHLPRTFSLPPPSSPQDSQFVEFFVKLQNQSVATFNSSAFAQALALILHVRPLKRRQLTIYEMHFLLCA
jgi:hypothetical protein